MTSLHPAPSSNGATKQQATVDEPVGEVIESTTTYFRAQAASLDAAPPFGSFVHVAGEDCAVYGVVARVETGGIDASARPVMRGYGDVRDQRIYEENPDLPLVLRTTFQALVVGFVDDDGVAQYLPERPPRLHYSVREATPDEVIAFTDAGLGYLPALLTAPDVANDELVAANIRFLVRVRGQDHEFARSAGRELAQLLRAEYPRFAAIVRRMAATRAGGRLPAIGAPRPGPSEP